MDIKKLDMTQANKLVSDGLAYKKEYPEQNMIVWKYSRKTHFDNLMHFHPYLPVMRGLVTDYDGNIITKGFSKVWNYMENGAGAYVSVDQPVIAVYKANGFLGLMNAESGMVSTTGTLDSDMAILAENVINKTTKIGHDIYRQHVAEQYGILNFLFEVCDPIKDPHIVEEPYGAMLIGAVDKKGRLLSEEHLDVIAEDIEAIRPEWKEVTFGEALEMRDRVKHEGFMIRDPRDGSYICKLKTPYYLAKKGMMRVGKNKADLIFDRTEVFKKRVDEEFHDMIDWVVDEFTKEQWLEFDEQTRRETIEFYFLQNNAFGG